MVSTRGRPRMRVDGVETTTSTAHQPGRVEVVVRPSVQPVLGGGPEVIPQVDLALSHPVIEDHDVSNKRIETIAENIEVIGSGGTGHVIRTEEPITVEARQGKIACSYKTFLCCRPPEFSGSEDPVACIKWIQEIEQAFGSSKCGDDQKVRFSSQMLRDTALTLWNVTQSTLSPTVLAQLSWAEFKKKVLEEYCSERALDRIEAEGVYPVRGFRGVLQ
ncbi:hypothetical protein L6452_34658 [Arctium lappa]|uniref:Uncharacterized protein n=1 Tax=Arctium lappa TaxID=4217 RepID=A0ACB8YIX7_ARCLA|nr:hypothetical protein L6452_34658 [Arctium lappa]